MKNLEERALKWFLLSKMHLFQKSKKVGGQRKAEILSSRTMITLEEYLSPKGETSSAFIVKNISR